MAEYIERDAYVDLFKGEHNLYSWEEIEEFMDSIPTADVQPVKHGWWVNTMPVVEYKSFCQVKCSVCESIEAYGNFCRNCGADMRGE